MLFRSAWRPGDDSDLPAGLRALALQHRRVRQAEQIVEVAPEREPAFFQIPEVAGVVDVPVRVQILVSDLDGDGETSVGGRTKGKQRVVGHAATRYISHLPRLKSKFVFAAHIDKRWQWGYTILRFVSYTRQNVAFEDLIKPLRIPVFVSCPSRLSARQKLAAELIASQLENNKLAWRSLGRSDYPYEAPINEVVGMIRHCSGGVILGFTQYEATSVAFVPTLDDNDRASMPTGSEISKSKMAIPTPWNQLEAGIILAYDLPTIILKEKEIEGGVFDPKSQDLFIGEIPNPPLNPSEMDKLESVFQIWASKVKSHYYRRTR